MKVYKLVFFRPKFLFKVQFYFGNSVQSGVVVALQGYITSVGMSKNVCIELRYLRTFRHVLSFIVGTVNFREHAVHQYVITSPMFWINVSNNLHTKFLPNFLKILKIKPEHDTVSKYVRKISKQTKTRRSIFY